MNGRFSSMHKMKTIRFGNLDIKRQDNANKLKLERQARRTRNFNERRNIITDDILEISEDVTGNDVRPKEVKDIIANRKLALKKYVAEREAIKKAIKEKQRPPFKVGIPHHGSSPVLKDLTNYEDGNMHSFPKVLKAPKQNLVLRNQRVTRSSTRSGFGSNQIEKSGSKPVKSIEQRSIKTLKASPPLRTLPFKDQKSVFHFHADRITSAKKLTSPHTPTVLKRSARKNQTNFNQMTKHNKQTKILEHNEDAEVLATPLADFVKHSLKKEEKNKKIGKPKRKSVNIKNISSNTEFLHKQMENHIETKLEQPNKRDKCEEMKTYILNTNLDALKDELADQTLPTPKKHSTPRPNSNDGAMFQRARLDKETTHLLAFADEWETIALQDNVPKDVLDEIDSVVGNTRLLTRDKFGQFRGLIEEYENPKNTKPITCNDLDGFWDMIYLQVEQLVQRYTNLESLKNNNWIQTQTKKTKKTYTAKKFKPAVAASSAIKEMIQAKRSKLNLAATTCQEGLVITTPKNECAALNNQHNRRRTRSNSPSPYIAMQLSGICRSLGRSSNVKVEQIDLNMSDQSTLKIKVKSEFGTAMEEKVEKQTVFKETYPEERSENQENAADGNSNREILTSCKRFQLKPSNLIINDADNNGLLPKKTRMSSRQALKRRVQFDSYAEEKASKQLPVTPYRKPGEKGVADLLKTPS